MGLKLGSQKHEMAKTHTDQANFWLCYFFHQGTEEENTHQNLYLPVNNDTFHSKLMLGLEKRLSNCYLPELFSCVCVGPASASQVTS